MTPVYHRGKDAHRTPFVLVHGGALAASSWDLILPYLDRPTLAVDLPGRGEHPADLASVTITDAAESVVADIDAAGFGSVVLVGHSLAGCSMPATIGLLGDRVEHAVFVACTVPEDGTSSYDTLDPDVLAKAGRGGTAGGDVTRAIFGSDMDDAQFNWFMAHQVAEALGLVTGAVDLSPLRAPFPRTWVRPLRDGIIPPDKQMRFVHNVGGNCKVIDIDAGHMCMITQPHTLAGVLNRVGVPV